MLVSLDTEARSMKLSNALGNISNNNGDHQRHESSNDPAEKNPSNKDSSFELSDQLNLQISDDQEHIAQESGEHRQQSNDADVVCNQELIKKVKVNIGYG